ncbi:MAG TPA: hypothetical protein VKT80_07935, partial [Chloroflexota bacterium]|nr:hypothetical protein [Chloroflexota bacterium]
NLELAVNYSRLAADLNAAGRINFDWYKCPAWPDLIATVPEEQPLYVHFPLTVGKGTGDAFNSETKSAADWVKISALREQTATPSINLHLESLAADHPEIPLDSVDREHVERVTADLIRDVETVVARFGADRVIVENLYDLDQKILRASYLPAVIRQVVEETGCGFLFDLSHARLAARILQIGESDYIAELPVRSTREVHVTGIQVTDEDFLSVVRRAGLPAHNWERRLGRSVDHRPFSADDWSFVRWALDQLGTGVWGQPWILALEYGGVGKFYETFTSTEELANVVPRLYELVRAIRFPNGRGE